MSDTNKSSFQHICLLSTEDVGVSSRSAGDGPNGGGGGEAGGGRGGRGRQPVEQEPAFPTWWLVSFDLSCLDLLLNPLELLLRHLLLPRRGVDVVHHGWVDRVVGKSHPSPPSSAGDGRGVGGEVADAGRWHRWGGRRVRYIEELGLALLSRPVKRIVELQLA